MKKIWIITAMDEEAEYIISLFGLKATKKFQNISFFENEEVVLALTGVGKIQASIGTTLLCTNYELDQLINIGIAGSLLEQEANIGDVFIVNKLAQHDMYLPFDGEHLNYAKGQISLPRLVFKELQEKSWITMNGFCLTGDQFIDDAKKVWALREETQADIVEMEAFAVASVAREFGLLEKLVIIKAISDGADSEAREAHESNLDLAMRKSIEVLQVILDDK